MPIESYITDPSNDYKCHIDAPEDERHALIVANRELKKYKYTNQYFINNIYGIDMNKNGSIDPSGPFDLIYDEDTGTPGEWNFSTITGAWIFNSTTHPYSGTYCIDATGTKNDHVCEANYGSDFDLTGYFYLIGHVYITLWDLTPTHEVLVYGWNSVTDTIVGNSVNIGDYVNISVLNTWQTFIIPLSDMGLTGESIDSIRFRNVKIGGNDIDFYLDTIQFEGVTSDTTGVLEYKIQPTDQNEWWHICNLNMIIASGLNGTLTDATMPYIPYDSFLGVGPLDNGILLRIYSEGNLLLNANFQTLFDFLSLTPASVSSYGSDGVNTWLKIGLPFVWPVLLKPEYEDKIIISIRDDLSSFHGIRTSACGRIEDRLSQRESTIL